MTAVGCESGYCTAQFSFPCQRTVKSEGKKLIKKKKWKKKKKKIHRKKHGKQGRKKIEKKLPLKVSVQMGYY